MKISRLNKKLTSFLIIIHLLMLSLVLSGCGFLDFLNDLFNVEITPEITAEEKVAYVIENLYVPEITVTDVGLITEVPHYPDVSITWKSLNPELISDSGEFIKNGEATLQAEVSCDDYQDSKNYAITLNDSLVFTFLDEDFNNITKGTATNPWKSGILAFKKANIFNQQLRLYANSADADKEIGTKGIMEMEKDVINPKTLSFNYAFVDNAPTSGYQITLKIYYSSNEGVSWTLLETISHNGNETQQKTLDLTGFTGKVRVRFSFETNYRSNKTILIDNLRIERFLNNQDILSGFEKLVPKKVKESFILPGSTPYGGVVTWESSFPGLITNAGLVSEVFENTVVTLTATITGFSETLIAAHEIIVLSGEMVVPVEIFFIDIGKYGDSDPGEAIYIKIEDFDILIDAGQHSASFQAIKEVIDSNSNDLVIDYLFATHPDADHIGNMPLVFENYQILNLVQFYGTHSTQTYEKYVNAVNDEDLITECTVTDSVNNQNGCTKTIDILDEVFIEIIDTKNYKTSEPNTRSIVFVLEAYGTRVLFTGDADNGTNANLERDYMYEVGDIDILKAAHHGTKFGTSTPFLEVVDPEVVIITNGNYFGNKHGHPSWEAINRIYAYDSWIKILALVGGDSDSCSLSGDQSYKCNVSDRFVDRNGTIKIMIDLTGYEINAEYYEIPLELSDTVFWKTHPKEEYSYGG